MIRQPRNTTAIVSLLVLLMTFGSGVARAASSKQTSAQTDLSLYSVDTTSTNSGKSSLLKQQDSIKLTGAKSSVELATRDEAAAAIGATDPVVTTTDTKKASRSPKSSETIAVDLIERVIVTETVKTPKLPRPPRVQIEVAPAPGEVLEVKFREDSIVRFRDGEPRTLSGTALQSNGARQLLQSVRAGEWTRLHRVSESTLDRVRVEASEQSGESAPDLNNWFALALPGDLNATEIRDAFRALPEVQYADRAPEATPPPVAPDFTDPSNPSFTACASDISLWHTCGYQGYLDPASVGGIDVRDVWTRPGGHGSGVVVCDVEYDFDPTHDELSGRVTPLSQPLPYPEFRDHGTGMLGIVGAANDGRGTTGIADEAELLFSPAQRWDSLEINWAAAISDCIANTDSGDVLLIEAQAEGPNYLEGSPDQNGLVALEWHLPSFEAMRIATQAGRVVVEAAGNGTESLDSAFYLDNHRPFETRGGLPVHDSGAIMVGNGTSQLWVDTDGTAGGRPRRHGHDTNWGSRVDVQAWGDMVVVPGSTALPVWSADGPSAVYGHHQGTSPAAAMIAGAAAVVQGIYRAQEGTSLRSDELRDLLKATGMPQVAHEDGGLRRIGRMPNLKLTADAIAGTLPPPSIQGMPGPSDPLPSPSNPTAIVIDIDESLNPDHVVLLVTTDGTEPDSEGRGYLDGGLGHVHTPGEALVLERASRVQARVVMRTREFGGPMSELSAASLVAQAEPGGAPYDPTIATPRVVVSQGVPTADAAALPDAPQGDLCVSPRIAFDTGAGDSPYVIYTLDGSEPDFYGSHIEGLDPTRVWTNYMTEDGQFFPTFGESETETTIRARNVEVRMGPDGQFFEVAGPPMQAQFRRVDCP
jgi:hypothetical protein